MADDAAVLQRPTIPEVHGLTPYNFADPLRAILTWGGTILPLVIFRFEMIFFVALHCLFVASYHFGFASDDYFFIGLEPWKMLALTSATLSFFIVFLVSQAYSRFLQLYNATTAMNKTLQIIASTSSVHFRNHGNGPAIRWQAVRYCIASAQLVYFRVNDGDVTKQTMDESEWQRMMLTEPINGEHGKSIACPPLLTKEEVAALKAWGGNKPMLLHTWALHVFKQALGADPGAMMVLAQLQTDIEKLRDATGAIVNTLLLPIPFAYFHICVSLTYFTYTILAVILVPMHSTWSIPFFFLVILLTSGMREVAGAMSDPFGDDNTDFPTEKFIRDVRVQATVLATNETLPPGGLSGATGYVRAAPPLPAKVVESTPTEEAPWPLLQRMSDTLLFRGASTTQMAAPNGRLGDSLMI